MGSICTESALQARHKFIGTQKNLVLQFLPRPRLIFSIGYEIYITPCGLAPLFRKGSQKPVDRQPGRCRIQPCRGPITTPWPLVRGAYYTGPDRIEHNIAGQFQEVGFLLHDDRLETSLEYMPHPSMPAIETLGVDSVQLPHTLERLPSGVSISR